MAARAEIAATGTGSVPFILGWQPNEHLLAPGQPCLYALNLGTVGPLRCPCPWPLEMRTDRETIGKRRDSCIVA